jgi:8-oxo-dGTP pyrophosphatase MutT (NUDIX family)
MNSLWTARCIVRAPHGIILVRNLRRNDALWKFPGGGSKPEDADPIDTMVREIFEETGIVVTRDAIYRIDEELRENRLQGEPPHPVYYGLVDISEEDLQWMNYQSGEDEEPEYFTHEQLRIMSDLLPANKVFLLEHKLWKE